MIFLRKLSLHNAATWTFGIRGKCWCPQKKKKNNNKEGVGQSIQVWKWKAVVAGSERHNSLKHNYLMSQFHFSFLFFFLFKSAYIKHWTLTWSAKLLKGSQVLFPKELSAVLTLSRKIQADVKLLSKFFCESIFVTFPFVVAMQWYVMFAVCWHRINRCGIFLFDDIRISVSELWTSSRQNPALFCWLLMLHHVDSISLTLTAW